MDPSDTGNVSDTCVVVKSRDVWSCSTQRLPRFTPHRVLKRTPCQTRFRHGDMRRETRVRHLERRRGLVSVALIRPAPLKVSDTVPACSSDRESTVSDTSSGLSGAEASTLSRCAALWSSDFPPSHLSRRQTRFSLVTLP